MAQAATPLPSLQEATKNSTADWQENLESLFHHAKDRFPDVVWELEQDEEVWGHKAIVYARAPPSFQNRYFARNNESTTALPYSDDYPAESSLSLSSENVVAPTPLTLLRLTTDISPALFSNELEYLYTGKGFGEAFEFLFDTEHSHSTSLSVASTSDDSEHAEALRIDKLRKDLVFMWRSRLYSDVRIALTGNFGATTASGHEATTAIFSSHRFILVSRSSYFYDALIDWPNTRADPNDPPTLTLPSPPFTPASVHFTLGFLYTGTLIFSHRSYDLSTAFAILRSALYLNITTLQDEIQARIAQEMMHGLFHAFLSFAEYEALTQGRWGTGGCRCRQCARRAPRVLAFAVADDVQNNLLERGARRALVGMFGEGWATQEFAQLSQKLRESLLKGVTKRTTPLNALPLLYAAEHALVKLANSIEPWADVVRDAILTARAKIDEVVTREGEAVFATDEWEAVVDGGGVHFDDAERVEWTMACVLRGVREEWAPSLYQTLVSSILLRPHPTEPNEPLLAATSHIRVQVEQTRVELLKWLGKNWLNVRQARGFDPLEGWSLKEISDNIEVAIDDLLSPPSYSSPAKRAPAHLRPASAHPHTSRADVASENASSMRVSVLSRVAGSSAAASARGSPGSPRLRDQHQNNTRTPSVHSLARSTASSVSTRSTATASTVSAVPRQHAPEGGAGDMSPAGRIAADARRSMTLSVKERPDSKFADDMGEGGSLRAPSIVLPTGEGEGDGEGEDEARYNDITPEASERGEGDGEESVHSGGADTGLSTGIVPMNPIKKKTLITRASLASITSTASSSRRSPATTATKTRTSPTTQRIKVRDERDGIRTRTASVASLSPSIRTRAPAGMTMGVPARPSSRGSTTSTVARARLVVKTSAVSPGKSTITSPRPPRTPSTTTFSRPTSRVSTRSTSGGARPASSASGTGTAESFRTASAGSAAGAATVRGSVAGASTVGTRSRRTSATSTMSTLSRHTASTATTGTASTADTGTPSTRGAPRLSAGAASSVASERARRVSGASVASSVASARSSVAPRATPVRKAASASTARERELEKGKGKERHLSPAAAIAAAAKARPAGKPPGGPTTTTTTVTSPRKMGASSSLGAVPSSGGAVRPRKPSSEMDHSGAEDVEVDTSDAGDETVVLAAPPVDDADMVVDVEEEDANATVKLPLVLGAEDAQCEADKENRTPSGAVPALIEEPVAEASPKTTTTPGLAPPQEPSPAKTSSTITVCTSVRQDLVRVESDHKKTSSSASSSSVATLRRKGSNDTIRTVKSSGLSTTSVVTDTAPAQTPPAQPVQQQPAQALGTPSPRNALTRQLTSIDNILAQDVPQGAMLEIGIPCIIASKRKRFKAYARYIGEVLGETGPWVGVEVPMPLGDNAWGDDAQRPMDDRPWHDGSWGGVRYFEIGGGVGGSEWEYGGGEDRAARRRRVDAGGSWGGTFGRGWSGSGSMGVKREGDQLSIASERMKRMRSVSPAQSDMSGTESRGLFVRPQQVLYVVDAVGTDL